MFFFSRVSGFLVGINRHEREHITSVTNARTFTNKIILKSYVSEFQTQKYKIFFLLAIILSIFLSFCCYCTDKNMLITNITMRRIACFRRKSTKMSARSQQLVGISRVSGFLFGIMNKTISRVLQTQGHNFTDKRWLINKILKRIVCFQRKYKKSARSQLYIFSSFQLVGINLH